MTEVMVHRIKGWVFDEMGCFWMSLLTQLAQTHVLVHLKSQINNSKGAYGLI